MRVVRSKIEIRTAVDEALLCLVASITFVLLKLSVSRKGWSKSIKFLHSGIVPLQRPTLSPRLEHHVPRPKFI